MSVVKFYAKNPLEYTGDLLAYCVELSESGKPASPLGLVEPAFSRAVAVGDFLGREGQTLLVYPEPANRPPNAARRVLLVGIGQKKDRDAFRKAGGLIAQASLKIKAERILLVVPGFEAPAIEEIAECLVEGVLLGGYQFRKYKTRKDDPEDSPVEIKEVSVSAATDTTSVRRGLKRGRISAISVCQARDMANEPGNFWTPTHFAQYGLKLADRYGLKARVLGFPEMTRLKMGGLLGVNQGSAQPPTMTILEYRCGSQKAPVLLLVGKGLTFDSGGISIKPATGMHEMKYDMCGGAAVLAVMQAVGEERPAGIDVIAIVPATENMPGPAALKPGDVISQYGGKTVEVENTDAEGRLILADALAYGVEVYKPTAVVDLATLTGAMVISLGHHQSGLMSTCEPLAEQLLAAGSHHDEPLWRMPLGPEYSKQLKSTVADLKNIGNRSAGAITAAAFLAEFVGDTPWAHLDIAGTAWDFTEKSYMPKGPSGVGVRTLLELIRNFKPPLAAT